MAAAGVVEEVAGPLVDEADLDGGAPGQLVLEADHGAWRQEVTMLVPMIIAKFDALCGEGTVTEVTWKERPVRGRNRGGPRK